MKIKLPFLKSILYLGRKEVQAIKQSYAYGAWQNNLQTFLSGGGYRVSFDTLYTIYNNVVDVKQATKRIQNAVLKEGYKTVDKNRPDKEGDVMQTQQLAQLLNTPTQSFSSLKAITLRDICIAGNAFWFILKNDAGLPLGIQVIDPRTMRIMADKYGNIKEYIQTSFGQESVHYTPEEIIHFIFDYSTDNALFGCSPIESIIWEAKAEMSAQMSNYFFYENNAVPSHLLILEENVDEEQMKELKIEIDKRFKGEQNRFKSGIIPFIKDIKTISPSQKEMEFIATRQFSTKKVCAAFGVDSFMLGYTEKVQRGNAEVVYTTFYQDTVRPYEVYFEEIINDRLLPALGLDKIKFVINQSSYDDEQRVWDSTRADVLAGVMTINEARALRNIPPSENEFADELMMNGILIDDLGVETQSFATEMRAFATRRFKEINNLLK
jgi:HK97 family phage portal protein